MPALRFAVTRAVLLRCVYAVTVRLVTLHTRLTRCRSHRGSFTCLRFSRTAAFYTIHRTGLRFTDHYTAVTHGSLVWVLHTCTQFTTTFYVTTCYLRFTHAVTHTRGYRTTLVTFTVSHTAPHCHTHGLVSAPRFWDFHTRFAATPCALRGLPAVWFAAPLVHARLRTAVAVTPPHYLRLRCLRVLVHLPRFFCPGFAFTAAALGFTGYCCSYGLVLPRFTTVWFSAVWLPGSPACAPCGSLPRFYGCVFTTTLPRFPLHCRLPPHPLPLRARVTAAVAHALPHRAGYAFAACRTLRFFSRGYCYLLPPHLPHLVSYHYAVVARLRHRCRTPLPHFCLVWFGYLLRGSCTPLHALLHAVTGLRLLPRFWFTVLVYALPVYGFTRLVSCLCALHTRSPAAAPFTAPLLPRRFAPAATMVLRTVLVGWIADTHLPHRTTGLRTGYHGSILLLPAAPLPLHLYAPAVRACRRRCCHGSPHILPLRATTAAFARHYCATACAGLLQFARSRLPPTAVPAHCLPHHAHAGSAGLVYGLPAAHFTRLPPHTRFTPRITHYTTRLPLPRFARFTRYTHVAARGCCGYTGHTLHLVRFTFCDFTLPVYHTPALPVFSGLRLLLRLVYYLPRSLLHARVHRSSALPQFSLRILLHTFSRARLRRGWFTRWFYRLRFCCVSGSGLPTPHVTHGSWFTPRFYGFVFCATLPHVLHTRGYTRLHYHCRGLRFAFCGWFGFHTVWFARSTTTTARLHYIFGCALRTAHHTRLRSSLPVTHRYYHHTTYHGWFVYTVHFPHCTVSPHGLHGCTPPTRWFTPLPRGWFTHALPAGFCLPGWLLPQFSFCTVVCVYLYLRGFARACHHLRTLLHTTFSPVPAVPAPPALPATAFTGSAHLVHHVLPLQVCVALHTYRARLHYLRLYTHAQLLLLLLPWFYAIFAGFRTIHPATTPRTILCLRLPDATRALPRTPRTPFALVLRRTRLPHCVLRGYRIAATHARCYAVTWFTVCARLRFYHLLPAAFGSLLHRLRLHTGSHHLRFTVLHYTQFYLTVCSSLPVLVPTYTAVHYFWFAVHRTPVVTGSTVLGYVRFVTLRLVYAHGLVLGYCFTFCRWLLLPLVLRYARAGYGLLPAAVLPRFTGWDYLLFTRFGYYLPVLVYGSVTVLRTLPPGSPHTFHHTTVSGLPQVPVPAARTARGFTPLHRCGSHRTPRTPARTFTRITCRFGITHSSHTNAVYRFTRLRTHAVHHTVTHTAVFTAHTTLLRFGFTARFAHTTRLVLRSSAAAHAHAPHHGLPHHTTVWLRFCTHAHHTRLFYRTVWLHVLLRLRWFTRYTATVWFSSTHTRLRFHAALHTTATTGLRYYTTHSAVCVFVCHCRFGFGSRFLGSHLRTVYSALPPLCRTACHCHCRHTGSLLPPATRGSPPASSPFTAPRFCVPLLPTHTPAVAFTLPPRHYTTPASSRLGSYTTGFYCSSATVFAFTPLLPTVLHLQVCTAHYALDAHTHGYRTVAVYPVYGLVSYTTHTLRFTVHVTLHTHGSHGYAHTPHGSHTVTVDSAVPFTRLVPTHLDYTHTTTHGWITVAVLRSGLRYHHAVTTAFGYAYVTHVLLPRLVCVTTYVSALPPLPAGCARFVHLHGLLGSLPFTVLVHRGFSFTAGYTTAPLPRLRGSGLHTHTYFFTGSFAQLHCGYARGWFVPTRAVLPHGCTAAHTLPHLPVHALHAPRLPLRSVSPVHQLLRWFATRFCLPPVYFTGVTGLRLPPTLRFTTTTVVHAYITLPHTPRFAFKFGCYLSHFTLRLRSAAVWLPHRAVATRGSHAVCLPPHCYTRFCCVTATHWVYWFTLPRFTHCHTPGSAALRTTRYYRYCRSAFGLPFYHHHFCVPLPHYAYCGSAHTARFTTRARFAFFAVSTFCGSRYMPHFTVCFTADAVYRSHCCGFAFAHTRFTHVTGFLRFCGWLRSRLLRVTHTRYRTTRGYARTTHVHPFTVWFTVTGYRFQFGCYPTTLPRLFHGCGCTACLPPLLPTCGLPFYYRLRTPPRRGSAGWLHGLQFTALVYCHYRLPHTLLRARLPVLPHLLRSYTVTTTRLPCGFRLHGCCRTHCLRTTPVLPRVARYLRFAVTCRFAVPFTGYLLPHGSTTGFGCLRLVHAHTYLLPLPQVTALYLLRFAFLPLRLVWFCTVPRYYGLPRFCPVGYHVTAVRFVLFAFCVWVGLRYRSRTARFARTAPARLLHAHTTHRSPHTLRYLRVYGSARSTFRLHTIHHGSPAVYYYYTLRFAFHCLRCRLLHYLGSVWFPGWITRLVTATPRRGCAHTAVALRTAVAGYLHRWFYHVCSHVLVALPPHHRIHYLRVTVPGCLLGCPLLRFRTPGLPRLPLPRFTVHLRTAHFAAPFTAFYATPLFTRVHHCGSRVHALRLLHCGCYRYTRRTPIPAPVTTHVCVSLQFTRTRSSPFYSSAARFAYSLFPVHAVTQLPPHHTAATATRLLHYRLPVYFTHVLQLHCTRFTAATVAFYHCGCAGLRFYTTLRFGSHGYVTTHLRFSAAHTARSLRFCHVTVALHTVCVCSFAVYRILRLVGYRLRLPFTRFYHGLFWFPVHAAPHYRFGLPLFFLRFPAPPATRLRFCGSHGLLLVHRSFTTRPPPLPHTTTPHHHHTARFGYSFTFCTLPFSLPAFAVLQFYAHTARALPLTCHTHRFWVLHAYHWLVRAARVADCTVYAHRACTRRRAPVTRLHLAHARFAVAARGSAVYTLPLRGYRTVNTVHWLLPRQFTALPRTRARFCYHYTRVHGSPFGLRLRFSHFFYAHRLQFTRFYLHGSPRGFAHKVPAYRGSTTVRFRCTHRHLHTHCRTVITVWLPAAALRIAGCHTAHALRVVCAPHCARGCHTRCRGSRLRAPVYAFCRFRTRVLPGCAVFAAAVVTGSVTLVWFTAGYRCYRCALTALRCRAVYALPAHARALGSACVPFALRSRFTTGSAHGLVYGCHHAPLHGFGLVCVTTTTVLHRYTPAGYYGLPLPRTTPHLRFSLPPLRTTCHGSGCTHHCFACTHHCTAPHLPAVHTCTTVTYVCHTTVAGSGLHTAITGCALHTATRSYGYRSHTVYTRFTSSPTCRTTAARFATVLPAPLRTFTTALRFTAFYTPHAHTRTRARTRFGSGSGFTFTPLRFGLRFALRTVTPGYAAYCGCGSGCYTPPVTVWFYLVWFTTGYLRSTHGYLRAVHYAPPPRGSPAVLGCHRTVAAPAFAYRARFSPLYCLGYRCVAPLTTACTTARTPAVTLLPRYLGYGSATPATAIYLPVFCHCRARLGCRSCCAAHCRAARWVHHYCLPGSAGCHYRFFGFPLPYVLFYTTVLGYYTRWFWFYPVAHRFATVHYAPLRLFAVPTRTAFGLHYHGFAVTFFFLRLRLPHTRFGSCRRSVRFVHHRTLPVATHRTAPHGYLLLPVTHTLLRFCRLVFPLRFVYAVLHTHTAGSTFCTVRGLLPHTVTARFLPRFTGLRLHHAHTHHCGSHYRTFTARSSTTRFGSHAHAHLLPATLPGLPPAVAHHGLHCVFYARVSAVTQVTFAFGCVRYHYATRCWFAFLPHRCIQLQLHTRTRLVPPPHTTFGSAHGFVLVYCTVTTGWFTHLLPAAVWFVYTLPHLLPCHRTLPHTGCRFCGLPRGSAMPRCARFHWFYGSLRCTVRTRFHTTLHCPRSACRSAAGCIRTTTRFLPGCRYRCSATVYALRTVWLFWFPVTAPYHCRSAACTQYTGCTCGSHTTHARCRLRTHCARLDCAVLPHTVTTDSLLPRGLGYGLRGLVCHAHIRGSRTPRTRSTHLPLVLPLHTHYTAVGLRFTPVLHTRFCHTHYLRLPVRFGLPHTRCHAFYGSPLRLHTLQFAPHYRHTPAALHRGLPYGLLTHLPTPLHTAPHTWTHLRLLIFAHGLLPRTAAPAAAHCCSYYRTALTRHTPAGCTGFVGLHATAFITGSHNYHHTAVAQVRTLPAAYALRLLWFALLVGFAAGCAHCRGSATARSAVRPAAPRTPFTHTTTVGCSLRFAFVATATVHPATTWFYAPAVYWFYLLPVADCCISATFTVLRFTAGLPHTLPCTLRTRLLLPLLYAFMPHCRLRRTGWTHLRLPAPVPALLHYRTCRYARGFTARAPGSHCRTATFAAPHAALPPHRAVALVRTRHFTRAAAARAPRRAFCGYA